MFASAMNNQFTPAVEIASPAGDGENHRTRIYAAMNPSIKVDELSMPMDEGYINGTENREQG